ncbi:hypothetical protein HQN60_11190 [Deefgea piscis]|uniref:Uncharacterized protein n=1 Tax=Deefgea piscis TaxID=2739061 RepID=A0A6M8SV91_9NEIS|nr:hypothetical protein [Deefgea piscis]QKJ67220.1 hypothetical protein HQN60_11190 [Deefgea piscis]
MGINQAKQEAKRLKQDHQAAGHIEDDNTEAERILALNAWKKAKALKERQAAAERHIAKAELEKLKRKKT